MEHWVFPPAYDSHDVPPAEQRYWFPRRETMPEDERDARILARLREVMTYAYEHSGYYREHWSAAGIEPAAIRSFDDFEAVPVTTKADLRREQEEHPPFGRYLCVPVQEVSRVHGTSGTTGRPTAFAIGARDWAAIGETHARTMWAMGIRPSDTVFVGAFFSLYLGSWGALAGAERMGCTTFPFGAGAPWQTERAATWLHEIRPQVFYGTPSYALHLVDVARSLDIDPGEFGFTRMFFSGEPGASIPAIRARLQRAYGAAVFDTGSMAEMTPWMNLAETEGSRGMLVWQDVVYTEVCDPVTHRRVPYGAEGTPVYTHLERTSQPMIRLLSGDLTRWEAGPSPCGRTYPSLPDGVYGRIDDMFIVRGENLYPSAIDEVLNSTAGYGGEHRIIVSRERSMDTLVVNVECSQEVVAGGSRRRAAFEADIASGLRRKLGVGASVHVVEPGTFEATDFKARRVIDNRDLYQQATTA